MLIRQPLTDSARGSAKANSAARLMMITLLVIHLFQKTLSGRTASAHCQGEIARPTATMVTLFDIQRFHLLGSPRVKMETKWSQRLPQTILQYKSVIISHPLAKPVVPFGRAVAV